MKKIAQGAEAIVYQDKDRIIKERFCKEYRVPELDRSLRQFRTRREAKVLQRLKEMNFPSPHLIEFSDTEMKIVMTRVEGDKVRDVLKKRTLVTAIAAEMGRVAGLLHCANIIHGDLTTSNMILQNKKVYLLDFGLSFFSEKEEDKAVDLFLLERALESAHYEWYPKIWNSVVRGYLKGNPKAKGVLDRLELVRQRGRNKKKNVMVLS